jgi:TRAP-type uncharacterized transport system substrate-binding protein
MQPTSTPEENEKINRLVKPMTEMFGLSRALALLVIILSVSVLVLAIYWFFHSAPPRVLTITAGPDGSAFQTNAQKYSAILASNGVTLRILPSQGSEENLKRLNDPSFQVDVGFVQGGVTNDLSTSKLVSLGSISYEPLLIFYRGDATNGLLSDLVGRRLAIGADGSGTHSLAMTLLALNGMTNGLTTLLNLDADAAAAGLTNGTVDAAFVMGDSASPELIRRLLRSHHTHLLNISQADGYTRRISYLNKLELPMGSLDFGNNIPARDVQLIGPTVEILARPTLHPALCDLLLEAAQKVNGGASLLKRKGEFPAPLEHDFAISDEASRYYKSGKSFLYKYLPFWLASLANRILLVFVPLLVVAIPAVKAIPALFKWRVRQRIFRRYRALLALEREVDEMMTPQKREKLVTRLDSIEEAVNKMKVPVSFADQFYSLRGHITFVRSRLIEEAQPH